jgi:hypothetical protein
VDTPEVTRTTATRSSPGWIRGAAVVPVSGFAALILGGSADGTAASPWAPVALGAVLAGGGILAANQADPPFTRRRMLGYSLMPLPTVLFLVLAGLTIGLYRDDFAASYTFTVTVIALWEAPLVVTLLVRSKRDERIREERQRLRVPFGPPPLEGELAEATRNGRSTTVIREYVDDSLGRKQLEVDQVALLPHGYELLSAEEKRRPEVLRFLGQLFTVLFLRTIPDAETNDDRIIATFQRPPK